MVTEDPERERLFARVVEHMPGCAEYQSKTSRTIPVGALRVERLRNGSASIPPSSDPTPR